MRRRATAATRHARAPDRLTRGREACCSRTSIRRRRASGSRRSTPSCEHDGPERAQHPARARRRPRPADAARRRRRPAPRPTSTRSRRSTSPSTRSTRSSSGACARSCAGTRSRWCSRRTRSPPSSAATSPATSRRRRSTRSASTTSGTRPSDSHGGDLVYMQGHSSPGIYARAFLEGRLTEEQLRGLPHRRSSRNGLLVVPAPVADAGLLAVPDRLDGARPDHGDLPGPLHEVPRRAASVADTAGRKVWAFLGDGETDEPESLGAISLAGRERLDNLIFVINCNLQRLDGPVRGNGKIIQELETDVPRRGLERHQGGLGLALGPAAGARPRRPAAGADGGGRRRRLPDLQVARRRLRARALLRRPARSCGRWSPT